MNLSLKIISFLFNIKMFAFFMNILETLHFQYTLIGLILW